MNECYSFRRLLPFISLASLLTLGAAQAQVLRPPAPDTLPIMQQVALDSVMVAPVAVDTKEWLLLNKDIQTELDGAVHNLYNFKFDKAEK